MLAGASMHRVGFQRIWLPFSSPWQCELVGRPLLRKWSYRHVICVIFLAIVTISNTYVVMDGLSSHFKKKKVILPHGVLYENLTIWKFELHNAGGFQPATLHLQAECHKCQWCGAWIFLNTQVVNYAVTTPHFVPWNVRKANWQYFNGRRNTFGIKRAIMAVWKESDRKVTSRRVAIENQRCANQTEGFSALGVW